jgi:hypothetical protein
MLSAKGAENKLLANCADRVKAIMGAMAATPQAEQAVPAAEQNAAAQGAAEQGAVAPSPSQAGQNSAPASAEQPYPNTANAAHVAFDDDSDKYYCAEGLCAVHRDRRMGFIDASGKVIVPFDFFNNQGSPMPSFHDGIAMVYSLKPDGASFGFKYIDKQGKTLFPGQTFEYAYPFSEGVALVAKAKGPGQTASYEQQWSFIDKQGRAVSPVIAKSGDVRMEIGKTDNDMPFHNGLMPLQLYHRVPNRMAETRDGYVNSTGRQVIDGQQWSSMKPFSEGLAWVLSKTENKWGAIDATGRLVIPYTYNREPGPFSEGMAAVFSNDDQLCYIDKTNAVRVPCKYDGSGTPFRNGYVILRNNADGNTYAVDKDGNQVKKIDWELCADNESAREDGTYCIHTFASSYYGSSWMIGLIKSNGDLLIAPARFTFIGEFRDGLAYAAAFPRLGVPVVQGFINDKFDFVVLRDEAKF